MRPSQAFLPSLVIIPASATPYAHSPNFLRAIFDLASRMSSSSDEAAVDPDPVVDQPTAEGSDVAKKRKVEDKSKWKKIVQYHNL